MRAPINDMECRHGMTASQTSTAGEHGQQTRADLAASRLCRCAAPFCLTTLAVKLLKHVKERQGGRAELKHDELM